MIGAVILFMLSVGSVRGFALYLGITTFCDLIICYTFTRPRGAADRRVGVHA